MLVHLRFDINGYGLNEQINIARSSRMRSAKIKKKKTSRVVAAYQDFPHKFNGKVWLSFDWTFKTLQADPVDNQPAQLKPILDGLVEAKVLKDDSAKIIQSPIIHTFKKGTKNQVLVTISDDPIWELRKCNHGKSI